MKSVLVFRSAALGDFVMASPALAEVRRAFPGHRVVLLTIQSASKAQREKVAKYAGDTRRMPWVELAMPHLVDEVVALASVTDLASLWGLRRQLAAYRFEAAILMLDPCVPWPGRLKKLLLMYFLVGLVPVLGWRGAGARKGNAAALKDQGLLKHHVHGPLQFLAEMKPPRGYREEQLAFDLRPGREAEDWVAGWIAGRSLEDRRLVAVAPGSIQPHKRWPESAFRRLIGAILAKYADVDIAIIGTPADRELGEALAAVAPERIHNLSGTSTIAQSAALLRRCALLVGNDGGAMHLGDAMGCKVVSIVPGIEYPDSIEPWHNKALAVRHPVECSPCYNFVFCPLGHNRCMAEMPLEKVLAMCTAFLERK